MYVTLTESSYEGLSDQEKGFLNFDWHWKDFTVAQNPMPLWTSLLPLAWNLIAYNFVPFVIQLHYAHMILHKDPALYSYIHKVHHLATNSIISDSGTESPFEFGLDEVNVLHFMHPIYLLVNQTIFFFVHSRAHDCYFNNVYPFIESDHHYKHHKIVSGNFSTVILDELSGTRIPTEKNVNLDEYNGNGKAE